MKFRILIAILLILLLTACSIKEDNIRRIENEYVLNWPYNAFGSVRYKYDENKNIRYYNYDDMFRKGYNVGCNRNLSGNITVHCFFIDDSESSWTKKEIEKFNKKQIAAALDFIIGQSIKWDVKIGFKTKSYHTSFSENSTQYKSSTSDESNNIDNDFFEQMAINMGYSSATEFVVDRQGAEAVDSDIYLMIFNKAGKSYARKLKYNNEPFKLQYDKPEYAVIYAVDSESNSESAKASTVAHEILHLYGAEDYYTPKERHNLANKHFFDDIMVLNTKDINWLEITEPTAFCIGWTYVVPSVFYNCDWWTSKEWESFY